jgi:hypothetical protein
MGYRHSSIADPAKLPVEGIDGGNGALLAFKAIISESSTRWKGQSTLVTKDV